MADRPKLTLPLGKYVHESYEVPDFLRDVAERFYEDATNHSDWILDAGDATLYQSPCDPTLAGRALLACAYLAARVCLLDQNGNIGQGSATAYCELETSRQKGHRDSLKSTVTNTSTGAVMTSYSLGHHLWYNTTRIIKPYRYSTVKKCKVRYTKVEIEISSARKQLTSSHEDDLETTRYAQQLRERLADFYHSPLHQKAMRRLRKAQYAQYLQVHGYTPETDPSYLIQKTRSELAKAGHVQPRQPLTA